jgi:predicted DNA-binding protein
MCAATEKSSSPNGDVFFNIRLKPEMHRRLVEIAKQNERTVSGEVRLALREHLERLEDGVAA